MEPPSPFPSRARIDHLVEKRRSEDPSYAAELAACGRCTLADARRLSDDELLARLGALGGPADRPGFAELTRGKDSAEECAVALLDARAEPPAAFDEDWLWFTITVLWQRLEPERPCAELLSERVHRGYEHVQALDHVAACEEWLTAWRAVLRFAESRGIDRLHELDRRLSGDPSVAEWWADLEIECRNAARTDPAWLERRIEVCEELRARFTDLDPAEHSAARRAIADSRAELGDPEAAERELAALTGEEPRDPWNWIFRVRNLLDGAPAEAARVLDEALAARPMEHRRDLLREALAFSETLGRGDLVARARAELDAPARAKRPGRNDPCPCGSGRKFKRCCLARGEADGTGSA